MKKIDEIEILYITGIFSTSMALGSIIFGYILGMTVVPGLFSCFIFSSIITSGMYYLVHKYIHK